MAQTSLVVFIGKPGVGKTTLIGRAFEDIKIMDVRPFVIAYSINGKVPEEKTLTGYLDMYDSIKKGDESIVLELGTNHPELNIDELAGLSLTRSVHIFICDAPIDTCRQRVIARARGDDPAAMERRLQKDFPNSHLSLLKTTDLRYTILDMEQPVEENIAKVKDISSGLL